MKNFILLSIFLSSSFAIFSQSKQDYNWILGLDFDSTGTLDQGYIFDFNEAPVKPVSRNNGNSMGSQATSISSESGELLFYAAGCKVLNKNGEVMPHGDTLNYDIWYEWAWNGDCYGGYPGSQDILILDDPGYEDGYYIIHKTNMFVGFDQPTIREIRCTYVDMQLDNGLGDVVYFDNKLEQREDLQKNVLYSYLTAIQHENGEDWWMIQGITEDSIYLTYLIDDTGVHLAFEQNSDHFFTKNRSSSSGTAKFSPDGTQYALYNWYDQLHLYDFDRSTGQLSNHRQIKVFADDEIDIDEIRFSALEWSPNGRFIYTSSRNELHQVDLWEDDPQDGIRLIDVYNGTLDPFPTAFHLLVMGPDCKIYCAPRNGSRSYHIIHQPDELGKACNFVQNGIKLPGDSGLGSLPNFPRFRVDEDEVCDPTLTSVFGDAVYYRRDLRVYPSPSDGRYAIDMPEGFRTGQLTVLTVDGQVVRQFVIDISAALRKIDITDQPSGVYHIELYPDDTLERVYWGVQVVKE